MPDDDPERCCDLCGEPEATVAWPASFGERWLCEGCADDLWMHVERVEEERE